MGIISTLQGNLKAKNMRSFYIVDNNQVILYNTTDYAIISDCKIENNTLTIYVNHKAQISPNNLKLNKQIFDKVLISKEH